MNEITKEIKMIDGSPFNEEKLEEIKNEMQKELTIAELVEQNPEMAERLTEMGFGCVGCSCGQFETLEDGIAGHGMNPEEVMKELNKKKS